MKKTLKENLSSRQVWQRGGFILIFALFYGVSKIVVGAIVLFQFATLLITHEVNGRLAGFSQSLSAYIYQLLQYMMCNSDEKPFPFTDWPASKALASATATTRKKTSRKKTSSKKKTAKSDEEDDKMNLAGQQD